MWSNGRELKGLGQLAVHQHPVNRLRPEEWVVTPILDISISGST